MQSEAQFNIVEPVAFAQMLPAAQTPPAEFSPLKATEPQMLRFFIVALLIVPNKPTLPVPLELAEIFISSVTV